MTRTSTNYRGYRLDFETFGGMVLVQIVSTLSAERYLLSGSTVFGTAEQAFDVIDDLQEQAPAAVQGATVSRVGERGAQAA